MRKLLVHLSARHGQRSELEARLPELATAWYRAIGGASARVTVMRAHENDSMRLSGDGKPTRAFDATIELKSDAADAHAGFEVLVDGLGAQLEEWIHADLSAVQLGTHKAFVDCAPVPIRYQYCMRRRHDFTPAAYLERYEKTHSQFGLKTQGIEGYCQFHIDPDATRRACRSAGFGIWGVSSVSELHLESLATFFAAAKQNALLGAQEDEDLFVDRPSSVMWLSDEVFRLGCPGSTPT